MKLSYTLIPLRTACLTVLITLLTTFSPSQVFSQTIEAEHIVKSRMVYCPDVAYTTTMLLQEYHTKQEVDTLQALLYYWESHCSMTEPMMRFLVLHLIETNTFYENWYPENILQMLYDYREQSRLPGQSDLYLDYRTWEYHPVHPGYTDFTKKLAGDLMRFEDLSPVEIFFLEFYSHNFRKAFKMQHDGLLKGTRLDSLFLQREKAFLEMPQQFFSFSGGLWKPTGNLHTLGSRPEFGLAYEFQSKGFIINTYFNLAVGNTSRPYHVVVANQLYETKTFMGIAIGLDLGAEVVKGRNTSLFMLPGIAYRGFETLNTDPEHSTLPSKFIHSFSPNFGLYLRNKYSPRGHIGLQMRYNLVNFKNEGGTDLSGNLFTMGLVFGFYN